MIVIKLHVVTSVLIIFTFSTPPMYPREFNQISPSRFLLPAFVHVWTKVVESSEDSLFHKAKKLVMAHSVVTVKPSSLTTETFQFSWTFIYQSLHTESNNFISKFLLKNFPFTPWYCSSVEGTLYWISNFF